VDQAFFQPLSGLAAQSAHARPCPEFSDEDFLRLGVQRVLESCESGRAFLQEHVVRFENAPGSSNYFAALQSERRSTVLREVNLALVAATDARLHDRLADIPELADYECFAADGHWHQAAAHDPRHEGTKMAVGHFYSLNLRTHTLRHLAAGQGLHEHDMSALKRIKPKGLRQDVPKGRRVLIIYDKAGIDFAYWKRCRQECAVYFLSRVKENMVYDWIESVEWDRTDARNHGVTEDINQGPCGSPAQAKIKCYMYSFSLGNSQNLKIAQSRTLKIFQSISYVFWLESYTFWLENAICVLLFPIPLYAYYFSI
jgi:hypothetical protein